MFALTITGMQSCSEDEQAKTIVANKVTLDKPTINIVAESTVQLTATVLPKETKDKTLTWSSKDASIATVNEEGLVTGVKAGQTEITCTTKNKISTKCTVVVTAKAVPVESIAFANTLKSIKIGASLQIKMKVLPENATNKEMKYTFAPAELIKISETGLITALKAGDVKITATSVDGNKTASFDLNIEAQTVEEAELITKLKTSENGWKAVYAGNKHEFGASNYLFTFGEGTLAITTDNETFKDEITTTYSVNGKSLIMGEENPFKKMFIAETDNENNMLTDCDFTVQETNENTIKLIGQKFNTVLVLEKASADDKNIVTVSATQKANMAAFGESNTEEKFFKILELTGGVSKLIEVDFASWIYTEDYRTMSVTYMSGDDVINETMQYAYTAKGFKLYNPLTIDGKEISNFEYNETTKAYSIVENNGVEGTISFSDNKAFTRKGIGAEFLTKSHQMVAMGNSTLAMSVLKDGADCNFFMGGEIGFCINYEKDGKTINSIMLQNNGETIKTVDMTWEIVGEDLFIGKVADQAAMDAMNLSDGEKLIIDYFVKGFYILPYQAILGYDTYLFVSKENSSMALGVFMMDTKK